MRCQNREEAIMKLALGRFAVVVLLAQLASGIAGADCRTPLGGQDPQITVDLVKQIEAKFGLSVKNTQFRCGGGEISFDFKPPVQIVPENSFFNSWNTSFSLGGIPAGTEKTNEQLHFLLAQPVEKIEALKLAQALLVREAKQIEFNFGLSIYIWPNVFDKRGARMTVSSPACDGFTYMSSVTLGEVHAPISNLRGLIESPDAPFYQEGELFQAIAANEEVLKNLDQVSRKIIESDKFIKGELGRRKSSQCSLIFDPIQDTTVPFSWNKTRIQFGLVPVVLE